MNLKEDPELAKQVAIAAGDVTYQYYRNHGVVESKGSWSSPVTIADREGEAVAVKLLEEQRPDDGILGEEGAANNPEARRRWLLDPLDATTNFTHQLPGWSSAVALVEKEKPLVSAVYQPETKEMLSAALGEGAYANEQHLRASDCRELNKATVCFGSSVLCHKDPKHLKQIQELALKAASLRDFGASSTSLALVAKGNLDAWVSPNVEPWDWYPGALLAIEAGAEACEAGEWNLIAATPDLMFDLIEIFS